ncbi:type I restriction-modification enzyme, S subunit [Vibrionales bacterium SWAT-3]|nr:type I restriction-modification enzyme, S subunit [Vibrionales bacterium SWAT-3]
MVPNGWEEKSLKDICKKTISYGIVQTGENIENGVPCVRVVDLSKNTLNPVEMIKTSDKIHQSYKKTILCEGELMMALRGEIGLVKKVTPELVGANITRGLARLSPIKSVDSDYLLWTLRSNKIKNELSRKSGGSALQEIALGSLRKVVLPIPPLPEQRKIAQILSTWDRGIATTEKLIETSKQQKKALMQQLLTGKKRLVNPETGKAFEGEWERHSMSDLVFIDRKSLGKKTPDDFEFQYISLSDVAVGSISKELEVHKFASAPSRARRVIQEGDILLSTVRPNLKGFAKVSEKHADCIASTGFSVLTPKKRVSGDYIHQYIFSSHVTGQIDSLVVGSNYPAINSSDVAGLKVYCPTYEEQQKIASVLTAADKEIEVLEAKLAHFKQEKKALMQQLLTGNRRVKVDEEVAA